MAFRIGVNLGAVIEEGETISFDEACKKLGV